MDFLFGADMPLAVRFFFAFVIVLALIGGTAFLVRRFGGERLGASSSRGRQPRLAVIDAAAVDGRRRLILIRRDNVEHLLMIGGPSDVVVEANIVRAAAPARDARAAATAPARSAAARGADERRQYVAAAAGASARPLPPAIRVAPPRQQPMMDEPAQWHRRARNRRRRWFRPGAPRCAEPRECPSHARCAPSRAWTRARSRARPIRWPDSPPNSSRVQSERRRRRRGRT